MIYTGWCENDFNVQRLLTLVLVVRSSIAAATSARSCAQRERLKIDLAYDTSIPRIYFIGVKDTRPCGRAPHPSVSTPFAGA